MRAPIVLLVLALTGGLALTGDGATAGPAAKPRPARPSVDVTGVYQSSYGEVRLEQRGNRITGAYACCGGGSIAGRIEGRVIRYEWAGAGGDAGRGVWHVVSRNELHGTWGSGDSDDDGGEWNLDRAATTDIAN